MGKIKLLNDLLHYEFIILIPKLMVVIDSISLKTFYRYIS